MVWSNLPSVRANLPRVVSWKSQPTVTGKLTNARLSQSLNMVYFAHGSALALARLFGVRWCETRGELLALSRPV